MEKDHFLTLKVMRLSSPSFALTEDQPFPIDPDSALILGKSALLAQQNRNILSQGQLQASETETAGITSETFSSYLCINNDSTSTIRAVTFKAELQTTSQRVILYDSTDSPHPNLITHQTIEFVLSHEIKELGVHILVCTLSYSAPSSERKSFRKFYKFQVLNPLAVKTKVNSLPNGIIFLEAQIQNVTSDPMYIERLRFDPFDAFTCTDLNESFQKQDISYINPHDIRQYLFKLEAKNHQTAHSITNMGKLDILWRLSMGELGRLQTSQLLRKPLIISQFDVDLIKTNPSDLIMEEKFTATFKLRHNFTSINTTSSTSSSSSLVSVSIIKERMASVLLCGASTHELGMVPQGDSLIFSLDFFPLAAGHVQIEGLKVTDKSSGTSVDCPSFDIFVSRGRSSYQT